MSEREVTKTISATETTIMALQPPMHIEVRERQNGSYGVFYADPGWIPCAPGCDMNRVVRSHKHDYTRPWVETYYKPADLEDAMDWAEKLAEGREVKLVPFVPLSERRKKDLTADEA